MVLGCWRVIARHKAAAQMPGPTFALPPGRVDVVGFGIKVIMTCTSVFVTNFKWMR